MRGFSKKGIAINELMGWILIVMVIFIIIVIVVSIRGNFDIGIINAIG